jgi:hypothetical protein
VVESARVAVRERAALYLNNAMRHGLNSISFGAPAYSEKITQIANKLCENDSFPYRYEEALAIAESQILIVHIRTLRAAIIGGQAGLEESDPKQVATLIPPPSQDNFCNALLKLASLERYERRALTRRRQAIRRFDALRD